MFCYSVRKQIAAMAAALDGIDLLVFTGGIGEHDAHVRASICNGLSWLGIFDDVGNASQSKVCVVPAQEEQQIAIHTRQLACLWPA
jgi:acetate kinase